MTSSGKRTRHSWEYAEGPDVGSEVPVTGEPRSEEKPGVPAALPDGDGERGGGVGGGTELREVRAADPGLSAETNERLTAELREAVAADRVEAPVARPRPTRGIGPNVRELARI